MSTNTRILEDAISCFNTPARREGYFKLYRDDTILHGYAGVGPGLENIKLFYARIWTSFPDAKVIGEDTVEQGDKVAYRFTMTGTHQGEFLGIAPTGKSIALSGITILRFENGHCAERWSCADFLGLMMHLRG